MAWIDDNNTEDADNESYKMAKELMERDELLKPVTVQDIEFVLSVMIKEAPYDEISIKQLFLGMLSAFTKLPIHHAVSSKDSGAGKSYLLVLVAGYIPKKYVVSLTGMSDKALLHKAGIIVVEDDDGQPVPLDPLTEKYEDDKDSILEELNNLPKGPTSKEKQIELKKTIAEINKEIKELKMKSEKMIVLENRIILLLDTTQDSLFNALMSLISQDTKDDQKYEYVDTNSSIGTKSNRFKGIPAIFTCQVIDDSRQVRYAEKNRRFIHVIPDTSSEKIQTAMDQIGLRYGLLPEEYDAQIVSREDKERAKGISSRLVEKLIAHSQHFEPKDSGIKLLFPLSITRSIMKYPNDVWGMTVVDRLNKYLAIITKMNMDNRPRLIDTENEGKFYPISTFSDLKDALKLMGLASSSLRPYIVDWYNRVFIPSFNELNDEPFALKSGSGAIIMKETQVGINPLQLGEKTAEVMHVPKPSSGYLLSHYLYPLLNLGIIDKVKSVIDGKAYIYFPVEEGCIHTLFKDDKDPRLEVTDPAFYPSRKMLEHSCRTIVEYYSKGGGVSNRKYRLVDHKGNDITPEELVDRYLSNPETCFKEPPLACNNIPRQFPNINIEQSSIATANTTSTKDFDLSNSNSKIINTGVRLGSQLILFRNPMDFFLCKIHPGILDNSMKVEFVTSKTTTNPTVRFLNRQTPEYRYYYSCYHCYDISRATFGSIDEYERHIVTVHKPGTVGYPGGPDIEKIEVDRVRKKQGRPKK